MGGADTEIQREKSVPLGIPGTKSVSPTGNTSVRVTTWAAQIVLIVKGCFGGGGLEAGLLGSDLIPRNDGHPLGSTRM